MGWLWFSFLCPLYSSFPISFVTYGFHERFLQENVSFSVNLTDRKMVFFSFPCPDEMRVEYLKHDSLLDQPSICGKGPVIIPSGVICFTSLQPVAIFRFWIIPSVFCPSRTLLIMAENQLDASAESGSRDFPVCVFTQFEASHFQMAITPGPNGSAAVRYFSSSMESAPACIDQQHCEYRSLQPFFAVVTLFGSVDRFTMKISYRVQARANKGCACTVSLLSRIPERDAALQRSTIGNISTWCMSASEELMNRILSLLLAILVTAGVLFVIHCMGVVKLFKWIGCGLGRRTFLGEKYLNLRTTGDAEVL
jgi:hypothetical protein